jgi:hypothetical protein
MHTTTDGRNGYDLQLMCCVRNQAETETWCDTNSYHLGYQQSRGCVTAEQRFILA